jgi:hypothetical protein
MADELGCKIEFRLHASVPGVVHLLKLSMQLPGLRMPLVLLFAQLPMFREPTERVRGRRIIVSGVMQASRRYHIYDINSAKQS